MNEIKKTELASGMVENMMGKGEMLVTSIL